MVYDGYVSRYLNRRISEPFARLLVKTPVTPNQVTVVAFGIAVLSLVGFILGQNIVAGLLVQLSSIVDGIDGSLARSFYLVFSRALARSNPLAFSLLLASL